MHRSWIPKPNKPGKMRPITPCKKDLIVMEAPSLLFNIVYEDVLLTHSHGFWKGRGPITFFAHVDSWGTVDRFLKADIVGCFDNIDHTLLNRRIGLDMGESSEGFCNSIFQLSKKRK
jgi:retron-type reverse transcriptase